jgi:Kdo2-lipid IVA lauroyltransferase/acyltransferase
VRPVRKPIFGPIFEDAMDAMGFEMIDRVGGLPKAVRALKKKRLLVIALDQFAGTHGIEVNFFNRGVSTFPTAAALAEKYDVPVFIGFLHRNEDGSNEATVVECVDLVATNDPEADIKTNTQLFTDKIQKIIMQHPETWMWMHRRWKDIPTK